MKRISPRERLFIIQRLSFLLKANIPLGDGLSMMCDQTSSPTQKSMLSAVLSDVLNGQSLHASLVRSCPSFGGYAINIIRVGEAAGILGQNLSYLYEELKKKEALRRKFLGALFYPGLIVFTTLSVTSLLMLYLFPKVLPVIVSLHLDLPATTKALIWLYEFWLHTHWWVIGLAFLSAVVVFAALKVKVTRRIWDSWLTRIPLFGTIFQYYQVGAFCRTLGLLLRSEIKVVDALEITAGATTNMAYKEALKKIALKVSHGETISKNLGRYNSLFPCLVVQLISIGERTGDLSSSLLSLADMCESEMDELSKIMAQALEPALMVILGLIIGFVAIAIITPFYAITQQLHR